MQKTCVTSALHFSSPFPCSASAGKARSDAAAASSCRSAAVRVDAARLRRRRTRLRNRCSTFLHCDREIAACLRRSSAQISAGMRSAAAIRKRTTRKKANRACAQLSSGTVESKRKQHVKNSIEGNTMQQCTNTEPTPRQNRGTRRHSTQSGPGFEETLSCWAAAPGGFSSRIIHKLLRPLLRRHCSR